MHAGARSGATLMALAEARHLAASYELTIAVPGETNPDGVPIQTCISAAAGACSIDH